jgi:small GTP-binding protein
VGDSGVGKTSLFWRYLHKETFCEEPMTTIDFRYKTISLHDKEVRLCIWDTAGQEKFRSIVATYFKSCQGVVLVFDLTSPASWENIKEVWYEMAFRRAPKAKYLLLGNKKDL